MNRCLGRLPRAHNAAVPHVDNMRAVHQPPIPDAKNWLDGMPTNLGMMLNDHLGCCPCAGLGHSVQVTSFNASGTMLTIGDGNVLKLYEGSCGYVDGDPSTDNGGILQNVLAYAVKTGIPTDNGIDRLLTFVEVDVAKHDDIKRTIAENCVAYLGIDIPESWTQSQPGDVWDDTSGPIAGGHCIIAVGYDNIGLYVISWGMIFCLTWNAFSKVCDEAYLPVFPNWFRPTGATPFGMTLPVLEASAEGIKEQM